MDSRSLLKWLLNTNKRSLCQKQIGEWELSQHQPFTWGQNKFMSIQMTSENQDSHTSCLKIFLRNSFALVIWEFKLQATCLELHQKTIKWWRRLNASSWFHRLQLIRAAACLITCQSTLCWKTWSHWDGFILSLVRLDSYLTSMPQCMPDF